MDGWISIPPPFRKKLAQMKKLFKIARVFELKKIFSTSPPKILATPLV